MTIAERFPEDRVREKTAPEINDRIDRQTGDRLQLFAKADREVISRRIEELDREWDMERTLETNAASLAFTGSVLGAFVSRKWLAVPMVVTGFLLMHAVQGWCPPVPVLRRMGVRTRLEIEKERYALKLLRGDFGKVTAEKTREAEQVLAAIEK